MSETNRTRVSRSLCCIIVALALGVTFSTGCSSFKLGSVWIEGGSPTQFPSLQRRVLLHADRLAGLESCESGLAAARQRYEDAELLAHEETPRCVDAFYDAACLAWIAVERFQAVDASGSPVAVALYNDCVARLISEGRRHCRLDPCEGLVVEHGGCRRTIPIQLSGFPWKQSDFHELLVVGKHAHQNIRETKRTDGIGVPIVVVRCKAECEKHECDFLPPVSNFPATVVLSPDGSTLDFINPLNTAVVDMQGMVCSLACDLTANLSYGLHTRKQTRIEDFLRPNRPDEPSRLYFIEPFQCHKIPVILVHGLMSSPDAWTSIYNDLRANPELNSRYQFWVFKYSTGAPFVRSAADLRSQLDQALQCYDPDGTNPNLRRAVVIGHSMGGLISKLLISHSGTDVWSSIANVPLEQIAADPATRSKLAERLFFEPYPIIQRAVFIATPHQGSGVAGRAIGRVASSLVEVSDSNYERLLRDNAGRFKENVSRGLPTSIDLLDPKQPFLKIMDGLKKNPCVKMHSIIGDGGFIPGCYMSDGIVSVDSASIEKVQSEVVISSTHNGLMKHRETVVELERILTCHLIME